MLNKIVALRPFYRNAQGLPGRGELVSTFLVTLWQTRGNRLGFSPAGGAAPLHCFFDVTWRLFFDFHRYPLLDRSDFVFLNITYTSAPQNYFLKEVLIVCTFGRIDREVCDRISIWCVLRLEIVINYCKRNFTFRTIISLSELVWTRK